MSLNHFIKLTLHKLNKFKKLKMIEPTHHRAIPLIFFSTLFAIFSLSLHAPFHIYLQYDNDTHIFV